MPSELSPSTQELLKAIGRASGKGLGVAQARLLFERLFAGELSEVQTGAALMALRVRGESPDELLGALQAAEPLLKPLQLADDRVVVVIPSYNGARLLPNLVPLLACLLADAGVAVLVHGHRQDPGRVTSAEIFRAMGIDPVETCALPLGHSVAMRLARGDPAFVPIDVLSPSLHALLERRRQMGVRNTAHSLVKLMQPVQGPRVLQLTSYTHAEFHDLQQQVLQARAAQALQSRGCEGEVVAHLRRANRLTWIAPGRLEVLGEPEGQEAQAMSVLPALPEARDIAGTAAWIQSVLTGGAPVPRPIEAQVEAILRLLPKLQGPAMPAEDAGLSALTP